MKKEMIISLSAAVVFCVSPLSAGATVEITDNRDASATADFSQDDFETKDYLYVDDYNNVGFVTVKNNSDANVTASITAKAYDSDDMLLGAHGSEIDVIGAGEESIAVISFYDIDTPVDHFDYEISYEKSRYYGVITDLEAQAAVNGENVTLTVTNSGNRAAQFLQGLVLFLDADNKVVGYDTDYLTDDESELKPGAALSSQFDCYNPFDHVECYFIGRSDGSSPTTDQNNLNAEDFEVKEYVYNNGSEYVYYYLVITNNSDKIANVSGNATAFGGNGNVIGAADCRIDVIGPGETSITAFYFSNTGTDFDHCDYQLTYKAENYYKPVINDLSAQASVNESNVVLTVTNGGSEAASFVQAYVLFLDAENHVTDTDYTYVTDDDSEIKPGATISVQLDTYRPFDHVEVYFTGRR